MTRTKEETRMTEKRKEKRRNRETKFSARSGGQCPPRQAPPISRSGRRKLSAFTTGWSCILLLHITCQNVEDETSLDEAKWIDKTYEFKMFKPNNTNIPNTYYVSTISKCMIPKKHISNFRSNQWLCSSLNKKSMILHNVLELHLTLRQHWRWTWGSAIITKLCGKKNNNEFMEMFCTCWNYAH